MNEAPRRGASLPVSNIGKKSRLASGEPTSRDERMRACSRDEGGGTFGRPFTRRVLDVLMSVGRHKLRRNTQDHPRIEIRVRDRTENSVKHMEL